jgi:UDP-glucose 4-epimerase
MARFLRHPRAPSLLGFDPMMQVIHEHDVVEALAHAVARDRPGIYNIAAEGVLPLSKIRRLVGKPSLPVFHKFAYWGVRLQQLTGLELGGFLPLDPDYIRYPWVGDLGRMRQDLGFVPSYTAEETLQEFARALRLAPYRSDPARRTQDETYLRDRIDQRHRATQDQVPASTEEGGTRA